MKPDTTPATDATADDTSALAENPAFAMRYVTTQIKTLLMNDATSLRDNGIPGDLSLDFRPGWPRALLGDFPFFAAPGLTAPATHR
jgi:hypothetical protein